jgi:putative ABC transport system substrate-binding protein
VDKILKDAKSQPTSPSSNPPGFELIIHLETVKALGFTIPPSSLARADQIIE